MPSPRIELPEVPQELREGLSLLRERLDLPGAFPADVLAEAGAAAERPADSHADRTDIPFVTIDPEGSVDLDQAVHIERADTGYLVHYAISDVAHFVRARTPLEAETHRRGLTKYAPGARIPLHPEVLSEGAASLLADGSPRPAMLWELTLDSEGELTDVALTRALVTSRAQLSYQGAQRDLDSGRPHPSIALLPEVGRLREERERARGGISLNLPEQEIVQRDGTWDLEFRTLEQVENWNAQISLLTGFAAARTMVEGGTGILRTLPPAEQWSIDKLRRAASTLGVAWADGVSYPDFVRSLSPEVPAELAVLTKCTTLFRGAGYVAFHGGLPEGNLEHSALAATYAHATAPLRRLVDRYVLEICHALLGGLPIPDWVAAGLDSLPEDMAAAGRSANAYERGVLDLTEALVLMEHRGEVFSGVVTDVNPKTGIATVQVRRPAVELRVEAAVSELGAEVRFRIDSVDVVHAKVETSRVS